MHSHHPSTAPEPIIETPEVHSADPVLTQRRGAHDAGLDGDVEVCFREDGLRVFGHDLGEGDEFGMAGALRKRSVSDREALFESCSARAGSRVTGTVSEFVGNTEFLHSKKRSCR